MGRAAVNLPERKPSRSEVIASGEPPANAFLDEQRAERAERMRALSAIKRNPEYKQRARNAVRTAIRSGVLIPQPCDWISDGKRCEAEPTEAHHLSYEPGRELDVRWLCKRHHDRLSGAARSRSGKIDPDLR